MTEKKCSKCGEIKDITEYYHCAGGKIRSECKPCGRQMCRDYKARNRANISEYNKEYKAEHTNEISVYNHEYNKNHRPEIQKRQTIQHRVRKTVDKNFNITCNLRTFLYYFIKTKGLRHKELIEELIACDWISIKLWFEYQFNDNMLWNNHGTYWSIDHVNPCCNFDLTIKGNQNKCFHWSNLRPVKIIENQRKTGKIIPIEIKNHQKIIKQFLKHLPKDEKYENNYKII